MVKTAEKTAPNLVITEGIRGTHFYHLSDPSTPSVGLCGMKTMPTSIPLSAWGYRSHLRERYCPLCTVYPAAEEVTR